MADFTAFNEYMVCDDDLKKFDAAGIALGYEFHVKYPTYRGAYLCNVMELEFLVDDVVVPNENIRFGVNGKWFLLSEISEANKEYWFTGAKATIRVFDDGALQSGTHKVYMRMVHKIPYTGYFGSYLHITSTCTKMLKYEG